MSDYTYSDHELRVHKDSSGTEDPTKVDIWKWDGEEWNKVTDFTLPTSANTYMKVEVKKDDNNVLRFYLTNNHSKTGLTELTIDTSNSGDSFAFGDHSSSKDKGIGIIDIRGNKSLTVNYVFSKAAFYYRSDGSNTVYTAMEPIELSIS